MGNLLELIKSSCSWVRSPCLKAKDIAAAASPMDEKWVPKLGNHTVGLTTKLHSFREPFKYTTAKKSGDRHFAALDS